MQMMNLIVENAAEALVDSVVVFIKGQMAARKNFVIFQIHGLRNKTIQISPNEVKVTMPPKIIAFYFLFKNQAETRAKIANFNGKIQKDGKVEFGLNPLAEVRKSHMIDFYVGGQRSLIGFVVCKNKPSKIWILCTGLHEVGKMRRQLAEVR